jgi:hypothetical protein
MPRAEWEITRLLFVNVGRHRAYRICQCKRYTLSAKGTSRRCSRNHRASVKIPRRSSQERRIDLEDSRVGLMSSAATHKSSESAGASAGGILERTRVQDERTRRERDARTCLEEELALARAGRVNFSLIDRLEPDWRCTCGLQSGVTERTSERACERQNGLPNWRKKSPRGGGERRNRGAALALVGLANSRGIRQRRMPGRVPVMPALIASRIRMTVAKFTFRRVLKEKRETSSRARARDCRRRAAWRGCDSARRRITCRDRHKAPFPQSLPHHGSASTAWWNSLPSFPTLGQRRATSSTSRDARSLAGCCQCSNASSAPVRRENLTASSLISIGEPPGNSGYRGELSVWVVALAFRT